MHQKPSILARPRPKHDESLSSWVNRLARENLCPPYVFCTKHIGLPLFDRDLDRSVSTAALNRLSAISGYSLEQLKRLQVPQYYSYGIEAHKTLLHEMLALVATTIGLRKVSPWTQFCSACLKESNYFRRHWRYSPITVCHHHQSMLYEACPKCHEPINFHRLHILHSSKAICDKCLFDLTKAPTIEVKEQHLLTFTRAFIESIDQRWFRWQSFDIHTVPFISGLYFLLRTIRKTLLICKEDYHNAPPYPYFIKLSLNSRYDLMQIVVSILKDWPETLHQLHQHQYFKQTDFYRGTHKDWPYWIWLEMRTTLNKGHYRITTAELLAAIQYLKARSYKISLGNLGEVLGHDRSFYVNAKNRRLIEKATLNYHYHHAIFHW